MNDDPPPCGLFSPSDSSPAQACDGLRTDTRFRTIFVAQIAGLQLREVRNLDDGTLDMEELREKLRPTHPDPHEPYTSLVCIENTHNYCGGTALPVEWIDQVMLD